MCAYIQKEPFCVVTDIYEQTIQDVTMRLNMGTKLPYNTQKNKALAPIRMHDGSLAICETTMAGDIHQGYLPYTTLNVLTLAFKQQGFPYDWGCKNGYNDCSGLAQSVYRCMGIQLPRNTSSMRRIQRNTHSEGGINFDYTQFMPGSILLSSGHTMILVGTIDKNPIIIHAFGSYKQPPTWEKRQVSATCITSMSDLYWTDGERSIESIGHVYEIK
jgi:cell wall-associated NlpC family hydrolase